MSHYYARSVGSAKTEATRRGTKSSGIAAHANSWSIGGIVEINWNDKLQTDVVSIYRTKGSNSRSSRILSYAEIDGKFTIIDNAFPELLI